MILRGLGNTLQLGRKANAPLVSVRHRLQFASSPVSSISYWTSRVTSTRMSSTASSSRSTPILSCLDHSAIQITPSPAPTHPLQSPTFTVPPHLRAHLQTASEHLHADRTVAFPTETVYGLGASSLSPTATRKIYKIKNRPADNPLIIHVSSLEMLHRLLPASYELSRLYLALVRAFWPGPLTLLFPSPDPPPPPAPQTNAIRMPNHPLALALINHSNLPLSAPSANSSGRPSPTQARHVWNDLNGAEDLGCILDGGDCGVGVESTVVNGLEWIEGGGGKVDVLRPGGLSVEEVARVVLEVDGREGLTQMLVHGQSWRSQSGPSKTSAANSSRPKTNGDLPPATPGQKYRHYSPRIPVYLLLPSNTFPSTPSPSTAKVHVSDLLSTLASRFPKRPTFGLLHYENSPLSRQLADDGGMSSASARVIPISLGVDATSAAQRLFSGMLDLEAIISPRGNGHSGSADNSVDAILIEGCTENGLGLAVMERINKAVGGGGMVGSVEGDEAGSRNVDQGRIWIQV